MLRTAQRSQAGIDFLTSYGFAILIICIAVYSVLQLGIFNYGASPQYCYSQPPFTCVAYSVNSIGAMELVLSQSSGGILTVNGIACSTIPNTTRVGPKYGNANVLPDTGASASFYPNSNLGAGNVIYPGAQTIFYVNCYGNNHALATGLIGGTFTGYVWVRYSFSGLPSTYNTIVRATSVSVKYT